MHGEASEPPTKRARKNSDVKGKGKAKADDEPIPEDGELEWEGESFAQGDDFIPFFADDESPRSTRKERAPEREWDVGKNRRDWDRDRDRTRDRDRDRERDRGAKRSYDFVFDEDELVGRAYGHDRGRAPSRKTPWVHLVDWDGCHNVAEMFHREVEAFVDYMSPTSIEDEIRGLVVKLVGKAVTSAFPDAKVLPFGSYGTKLYLPSGDIDLVIESDSMQYVPKNSVLHSLANVLKRAGIADKVTIIAKAKVPIVKFITRHGRLNVDISINQSNGLVAGQIVNGFLADMRGCGRALRALVMVAKAFLGQRGMNEVYTGGLGSYSIVCMAISFLQMHPKIRRGEIDAERNLGVLVMEFFELYGRYFNYEQVGISIKNGGKYFSKLKRGWLDFGKRGLLSIEDPTDSSNDISRGSYAIAKVRQTLAGAHEIMTTTAFLRAGSLSARREGRSVSLRGNGKGKDKSDPAEMSILSTILGVTQETINNRRLLQEVYDDRALHELLGVSPKPSVSMDTTASRNNKRQGESSRRGAASVEEAWGEAEIDFVGEDAVEGIEDGAGEDDEDGEDDDDDDDDEGRYGIQKRKSRPHQPDIVFISDEDDHTSGLSAEEAEYARGAPDLDSGSDSDSDGGRSSVKGRESAKVERASARRSYWLAKGVPNGYDEDSS
ncbi:hypothetical protein CONPUDRAFT_47123 [Coniophora puteana RWD-64-598 SS2]|uniref:polynucleotide adenylyltransferase n=1 Tax=Coniophora puteana (strain RWD-64-598) TaxID=741705 RepID=A0A5M3N143_CONPW|nr:uncharacterized protein CONPUDRAFT_47123 [Coniophora puteana RWD-64-598 SS2]EIW84734.1 hypothetical protein CONPUDRAFT_47123 [Coniophora puteana RWD-64-598 SS2]